MNELEHIAIKDLWADFTLTTPMEEAISTVEGVLREWKTCPLDKNITSRFGFKGNYYTLALFPANYSEITEQIEYIGIPKSPVDIAKNIFRLSIPFVLISDAKKRNIDNKIARDVINVVYPAAIASHFKYPFFVQIAQPEYASFIGYCIHSRKYTYYSSHMDFSVQKHFSSIESTKNVFVSTFKDTVSGLNYSARQHYSIRTVAFSEQLSFYKKSLFCSKLKKDPIKTIKLCAEWPKASLANNLHNPVDACNYCIQIEKRNAFPTSNTAYFMNLLAKSIQFNNWKSLSNDFSNQRIVKQIEMLFEHNDLPTTEKTILKAAPMNSILCRLTEMLANTASFSEFATLWNLFVTKLRQYYDQKKLIPGVDTKGPNFNHCLLYQKLEMINFCLQDENCIIDELDQSGKLLISGEKMIFPATQVIPVRTEDQIQESEQLLFKNADDQRQKVLIQSKQLKSDMSAFKAANPTAVFSDFIRWYSPTDFNEGTKELSTRMSTSDNLWKELWETTPARSTDDQSPLFNKVEQCEFALDYIEGLSPTELIGDLVPVLLAQSYFAIKSEAVPDIRNNAHTFQTILNSLSEFHEVVEKAETNLSLNEYIGIGESLFLEIQKATVTIQFANSLLHKFPNCIDMVNSLMDDEIYFARTVEEKDAIKKFINSLNLDLNQVNFLTAKEFIVSGETEVENNKLSHCLYVSDYLEKCIIASSIQELI